MRMTCRWVSRSVFFVGFWVVRAGMGWCGVLLPLWGRGGCGCTKKGGGFNCQYLIANQLQGERPVWNVQGCSLSCAPGAPLLSMAPSMPNLAVPPYHERARNKDDTVSGPHQRLIALPRARALKFGSSLAPCEGIPTKTCLPTQTQPFPLTAAHPPTAVHTLLLTAPARCCSLPPPAACRWWPA